MQISAELGHGRIEVVSAYNGGGSVTKPFDMKVSMAGILTGAYVTRRRHFRQTAAIQDAISTRRGDTLGSGNAAHPVVLELQIGK
ncbi:hypothetical protein JOE29_003034 [Pseudomonas sp. PvP009]|jgi:hypothetical protein|nr:hypothetical protein [Pseudomonas sp. PvP009]